MDFLLFCVGPVAFVLFVFVVWILSSGIRIVNQYQVGLVLRLGRIVRKVDAGLHIIIPSVERIILIDTRTVTLPIQSQKIITKDNVSIDVAGVAYFRIVDPVKSFTQIANPTSAVDQIAQTTVREIIGRFILDDVLTKTDEINTEIRTILDQHTETWGIEVTIVQLKDIELPESMKRAMSKQAEAEREKRAKIIAAEGEFLASQQLAEAAKVMAAQPITLELRTLQTLTTIAEEKNSTIIFPARFMDIAEVLGDLGKKFLPKKD
jgi:regulator of protease activity HflC (stomatin/prohibitin superfamily)